MARKEPALPKWRHAFSVWRQDRAPCPKYDRTNGILWSKYISLGHVSAYQQARQLPSSPLRHFLPGIPALEHLCVWLKRADRFGRLENNLQAVSSPALSHQLFLAIFPSARTYARFHFEDPKETSRWDCCLLNCLTVLSKCKRVRMRHVQNKIKKRAL